MPYTTVNNGECNMMMSESLRLGRRYKNHRLSEWTSATEHNMESRNVSVDKDEPR